MLPDHPRVNAKHFPAGPIGRGARGEGDLTAGRRAMLVRVVVTFTAELWVWAARPGENWTFVSLPEEASEGIRELAGGRRRGFGAVRVRAEVGDTAWTTSIFPDKGRAAYVLPVKRAVREAQDLEEGSVATVTVELIDL
jgi:hypothetical protein